MQHYFLMNLIHSLEILILNLYRPKILRQNRFYATFLTYMTPVFIVIASSSLFQKCVKPPYMTKFKVLWLLNHNYPPPAVSNHGIYIISGIQKKYTWKEREISPTKLTYILLCKYSHFSFRSSFFPVFDYMENLFVLILFFIIIILLCLALKYVLFCVHFHRVV